jgi:hypothetical protein
MKNSALADYRTFQTSFGTRNFKCIVGSVPRESGQLVTLHRCDNVESRSTSLVNWLKCCLCVLTVESGVPTESVGGRSAVLLLSWRPGGRSALQAVAYQVGITAL